MTRQRALHKGFDGPIAPRAKWTVRVDGLQTLLAFGDGADERQPVIVSLLIEGLAPEAPGCVGDCFDTAQVCDWITGAWPKSAQTPLVETRVNELLQFLFAYDKRAQNAWVGLYRMRVPQRAARVGIERKASRSQFQTVCAPPTPDHLDEDPAHGRE